MSTPFIPDGYQLQSVWLDEAARKLFPNEYPSGVIGNAGASGLSSPGRDVVATTDRKVLPLTKIGKATAKPTPPAAAVEPAGERADPDCRSYFEPQHTDPLYGSPLFCELDAALKADLDLKLRQARDPDFQAAQRRQWTAASKINELKRRVFERYRNLFYEGTLRAIVVSGDGSVQEIPIHHWGGDQALVTVDSGQFCGRPILMKISDRPDIDLPEDDNKTVSHTIVVEKRCKRWLIEQMTASPARKTQSRVQLQDRARTLFNVGDRPFLRAWAAALPEIPPEIYKVWGRSGKLKR
jgi:hypothetical protein